VNLPDKGFGTPLHSAISKGTVVGTGMNMREVADDEAKTFQRMLIVKLLIDHKADLHAKTLDSETPMCRAIRQGQEKVLKHLVKIVLEL
jgi:ankyrin repeat protein